MEQKKKLQLPAKQIDIIIGLNTYPVKFPNNGQLIDMERMKIQLTDGTHKTMLFGQPSAQQAYLLTETIATFSILIPDLLKDLQVRSLLDLDPYKSKLLTKAYSAVFYPWFQQWVDVINDNEEEEKKDEEKKDDENK